MKANSRVAVLLAVLMYATAGNWFASACTGITIKTKDGAVVFGRTLEFAVDLQSNIIIVPRRIDYVGTTPTGKEGRRWTTKYGVVGMNAFNLPVLVDGLNEKGLQIGLFYFPGFAKYQAIKADDAGKTLAPWELGTLLLGTCADVTEAVVAARDVRVGNVVQKDMGFVPPVHYIVSDAGGNSVVLEHIAGELKIPKNPLGVMSNSPSFDWHMTNLSNYVNQTVSNVPKLKIGKMELKGFGQGSGMLGLPGDFTPPSRFVRAVAFSKSALPVDTARAGVLQAFHILNQFDIPKGAARGVDNGKQVADYTLWTSVSDLKNRRYYFRTYENSRIRMIDLMAVKFDASKIGTISTRGQEEIEDVSGQAK
ncbi:MAG: choloylglycine hydrolase family protein [Planctomycetes bacterium]|nr:choloylglycine hydrolase family protein [Planctomycetota bacterium]